jgi:hypothetical protein
MANERDNRMAAHSDSDAANPAMLCPSSGRTVCLNLDLLCYHRTISPLFWRNEEDNGLALLLGDYASAECSLRGYAIWGADWTSPYTCHASLEDYNRGNQAFYNEHGWDEDKLCRYDFRQTPEDHIFTAYEDALCSY